MLQPPKSADHYACATLAGQHTTACTLSKPRTTCNIVTTSGRLLAAGCVPDQVHLTIITFHFRVVRSVRDQCSQHWQPPPGAFVLWPGGYVVLLHGSQ